MPVNYTVPTSSKTGVRKVGNASSYASPIKKGYQFHSENSGGAFLNPNLKKPSNIVAPTGNPKQSTGQPGVPTEGTHGMSGVNGGAGGFASRYKDDAGSLLQYHPEVILADAMRSQGINPNGGAYGMAADYAPLVNALYMASGQPAGSTTDMVNWAAKYFGGLSGSMGNNLNVGDMIQNILSAGGGKGANGGKGSPIYNMIAGIQDPMAQVDAVNKLVSAVSNYGIPIVMQKALENNMNMMERDYYTQQAHTGSGGPGNYYDYLNSRANDSMLNSYVK